MKALRLSLLIIVLSLLPLISIFSTSLFPHTHDGVVHLARMAAYFKALGDGQIPVRWAGDLNYGYGMPLFNFIYQLPYFFASIFLFLGFGLVNSFKIVLAASFIFSGLFMFLFTKEFFTDSKKAILVTIFYQFAPFRLVELLVRGSFGEVYTYTFLPLVLFGLVKLFKKPTFLHFLITSFATALLILSHNSLSLVFFLVSFLFLLFFSNKRRLFLLGSSALLLGLALSAFYWLPAIFEHKYTYGDLFMKDLYLLYFPPIQNLFTPNFTNSVNLQVSGVSVQFGLFHTLAILLSLFFFSRQKIDLKTKRLFSFCLVLIALSLFFMQPISKIVWTKIAFLRQFQFPWRFLAVISFSTSLLSVSFLSYSFFAKKVIFLLLLILVAVSTIYYWRPLLGFDKIDEKYYWNYPLNTTYFGETDLIWSEGPARSYPKNRVDVIGGKASVLNFTKKSNLQTFEVLAKTDAQLVNHTQYFPGWRVYVDGKAVPIQFQDQNHRGEMVFSLSSGRHFVRVAFGETKLRLIADIVSLSSLVLLLLFGAMRRHQL